MENAIRRDYNLNAFLSFFSVSIPWQTASLLVWPKDAHLDAILVNSPPTSTAKHRGFVRPDSWNTRAPNDARFRTTLAGHFLTQHVLTRPAGQFGDIDE